MTTSNFLALAAVAALASGCTIKAGYTSPDPNPPTVRHAAPAPEAVHTRREPVRREEPEPRPANAPRIDAGPTEEECASDRAERHAHAEAIDAWEEKRDAYDGWTAEHCKNVDYGRDTLITEMDHAGRITQRVATVGPVKLECDAKRPANVVKPSGPRPRISYDEVQRNRRCDALDSAWLDAREASATLPK